jgi:2-dehydro-3-deoxygalactonokinase
MTSRLLAVDWGSSALRGALLDEHGAVIEQRAVARGMLTVPPGGFAEVFESQFADWMDVPGTRCLMAGMVGSKQGWFEAPYCPCPAGLDEVAAHLARLPAGVSGQGGSGRGRDIAIVPGLSCEVDGVPDVIRGEEVKVFGAIEMLGLTDGVIASPGTHSKWVTVQGGRVTRFSTVMSGEFYALLRQHSILSRSLPTDDGPLDEASFDRGVGMALQGAGLMQTVFSVRTLSLFDRMASAALPSYLSGLVIGEELRCRSLDRVSEVVLIGAPVLTQRFERALRQQGVRVRQLGEEAAWRGLAAIDRRRRAAGA